MYKHILIPTDGSPESRTAIREGIALAKQLGARVTGFYSPEQYEVLAYGEYFPPNLISRGEWTKRSKQTAEKYLAPIEKAAKAANLRYEGYYKESIAPWQAIVDAAKRKKCDLIFMASHGRTGIQGMVLGSQAAKVLSHSPIPVLVHKAKKRTRK
ncbi:MAG: universal stress protein [Betaproteobacteria bacterium]|nr:MAG: universal stress protein [Betaproteobacteria bacterium]